MENLEEKIYIDDLISTINEERIRYRDLLVHRDLLVETRQRLIAFFSDEKEECMFKLKSAFDEYNDSLKRSWEIHGKGSNLREDIFDYKRILDKKDRFNKIGDGGTDDYYDRVRVEYYKLLDKLDPIDYEYEESVHNQKFFRKRLLFQMVCFLEKIKEIYPNYSSNNIFKLSNKEFMSFERASKEKIKPSYALRENEIISYFEDAVFEQIDGEIDKTKAEITNTQSYLYQAMETLTVTNDNSQNASVIMEYINHNNPDNGCEFREKIKSITRKNLN